MSNSVPEGWNIYSLDELGQVVGGGTPESNNTDYWGGDIYWATPKEITKLSSRYINKTERTITQDGLDRSSAKLHPIGTILLTSRASVGYPAINTIPMATNQGFQSLRPNNKLDTEYGYQCLLNSRNKLEKLSAGSTFLEISSKEVKKFKVVIPPLPEQKKIAAILTSVDTVIEKTQAQIDKLKDLKTGMMQELLTKGIGHTEFKDSPVGRIPVEWEIHQQGDKADFSNGRAYKLSEWEKEGTPVIRLQNLTGSGKDYYYSNLELPERQYCKNGDLLYMWSATFGPHIWKGSKAIYHYHIWKVTPDETTLTKSYLYYLLDYKTKQWKDESSNGMGILHVTKSAMESMLIAIPPIKEQQYISKTLEAIDKRINLSEEKFQLLKNTKKALMQDLLTGKVRVKI